MGMGKASLAPSNPGDPEFDSRESENFSQTEKQIENKNKVHEANDASSTLDSGINL